MRTPTRRLGRGLGAFLDFGPASDGGAAYVEGVLASETESILETSVARSPTPQQAPRSAPQPVRPEPAAVAPAATQPAADDGAFIDDVVFAPAGDDGAVYVEGVLASETESIPETSVARPPTPQPDPQPAPEAVRPEPAVAAPAAPAPAADDDAFVDDIVAGLSFPDVELD